MEVYPKRSFDESHGSRLDYVRFSFSRLRHGAEGILFNINISRSERSIDYARFSARNETSTFLIDTRVARRFSAVRHWVHDVFVFNTGVTLVTTNSI